MLLHQLMQSFLFFSKTSGLFFKSFIIFTASFQSSILIKGLLGNNKSKKFLGLSTTGIQPISKHSKSLYVSGWIKPIGIGKKILSFKIL